DEPRVLHCADPVPDPVRLERFERAAHRRRAGAFPRVWDGGQPERARERERRLVRLRRVLRLEPAEPDAENSAVAVLRAVAHDLLRLLGGRPAEDVRRQAHLDAVLLERLLGAVAVAAEDLVPADAAGDTLRRAAYAL